jgi:hypothetical protein
MVIPGSKKAETLTARPGFPAGGAQDYEIKQKSGKIGSASKMTYLCLMDSKANTKHYLNRVTIATLQPWSAG